MPDYRRLSSRFSPYGRRAPASSPVDGRVGGARALKKQNTESWISGDSRGLLAGFAMIRDLLKLPDGYRVLFLQGGGSLQFSMVPMTLLRGNNRPAEYLETGYWSRKAIVEARREERVTVPWGGRQDGGNPPSSATGRVGSQPTRRLPALCFQRDRRRAAISPVVIEMRRRAAGVRHVIRFSEPPVQRESVRPDLRPRAKEPGAAGVTVVVWRRWAFNVCVSCAV
jgi:hypothetical protein